MIQLILTSDQWHLIGDIRAAHVSIGAVLALVEKGVMSKDESHKRIVEEIIKTDKLWDMLAKEGL